jgi:hypothetical protein
MKRVTNVHKLETRIDKVASLFTVWATRVHKNRISDMRSLVTRNFHVTNVIHIGDENLVTRIFLVTN